MSDEKKTRTRKPNPYTAYAQAHAEANKVRRAAAKADELHAKAVELAEKAAVAKERLPEVEAAEQAAYTALQDALAELGAAAGDETDEGE